MTVYEFDLKRNIWFWGTTISIGIMTIAVVLFNQEIIGEQFWVANILYFVVNLALHERLHQWIWQLFGIPSIIKFFPFRQCIPQREMKILPYITGVLSPLIMFGSTIVLIPIDPLTKVVMLILHILVCSGDIAFAGVAIRYRGNTFIDCGYRLIVK